MFGSRPNYKRDRCVRGNLLQEAAKKKSCRKEKYYEHHLLMPAIHQHTVRHTFEVADERDGKSSASIGLLSDEYSTDKCSLALTLYYRESKMLFSDQLKYSTGGCVEKLIIFFEYFLKNCWNSRKIWIHTRPIPLSVTEKVFSRLFHLQPNHHKFLICGLARKPSHVNEERSRPHS